MEARPEVETVTDPEAVEPPLFGAGATTAPEKTCPELPKLDEPVQTVGAVVEIVT